RKIIYWNKAAEKLTGYKKEEILNTHCFDNILVHTNIKGEYLCDSEKCPAVRSMKEKKLIEEEVFLKHKEGYRIPILTRISPIIDNVGNVLGAVEIFSDNSARLSAFQKIEKLQNLAFIDSLTGIGNRRYSEIKIATRLEEIKKFGMIKSYGVLFIDIDHFKQINDRYGHRFGDDVLKVIAKTILKNIREDDFIGRWGGEEFIAVISNVDEQELFAIAEKIRTLINSINYKVKEDIIKLSVSVGATLIKENDEMEDLINRADKLMYKCKNSGRNCVSIG
ncbi:MAG: sensor domain-containing diguanylate cyclase, partial [Candidatus Goldbacteria bacterium]|nr:sensor domain-containing diguanylate cyclase [Candidatus Goldiibacteriota bacterium]